MDDELKIAQRFVSYINKVYDKDFCFSYHPERDEGIDALSYRESNPETVLKMQITVADREFCKGLETKGRFLRITNKNALQSLIEKGIKEPILKKLAKHYSPELKKDLTLLLDGWYTFYKISNKKQVEFIKNQEKKFFQNAGFKEIWLVYNDVSHKLYP